MKRSEAIEHVNYWSDDALSDHRQPSTDRTAIIGWSAHEAYVAVNSYLPDCSCDEDESVELATELLIENGILAEDLGAPDHIFLGSKYTGDFECYLLITEPRSGHEWVTEIKGSMLLDLKLRVKSWIKREYNDERSLDGELVPYDGDYCASIITNWRPRSSNVVWTSGGFYLK